MTFNSKAWAELYGEEPDDPFSRGDQPKGLITIACSCGDGMLYERKDVDHYVPVGACPDCGGWEEIPILCEACEKPFTLDAWQHAKHDGNYAYHIDCWYN